MSWLLVSILFSSIPKTIGRPIDSPLNQPVSASTLGLWAQKEEVSMVYS